eukprot:scaffold42258_cov71-Cyclotella_meneghiniana.AAC.9
METILYDPQETVDNPNRLAQSAPKSGIKKGLTERGVCPPILPARKSHFMPTADTRHRHITHQSTPEQIADINN